MRFIASKYQGRRLLRWLAAAPLMCILLLLETAPAWGSR